MTMRLLAIAFTAPTSGCCASITKEDAIQIAKREISRRNIGLSEQYTVDAARGTIVTESGPDIPSMMCHSRSPEEVSRVRFAMLSWTRVTVRFEGSVIFETLPYSGKVSDLRRVKSIPSSYPSIHLGVAHSLDFSSATPKTFCIVARGVPTKSSKIC